VKTFLRLLIGITVAVPAIQAASFSFGGTFTTDDQVQLFTFSITSNATVTFRTFGYGGGTNSAGMIIPHGGFDPQLTWYMANGSEVGNNNDGGCANVAMFHGACLDSFAQVFLTAGSYTLALTQSGNDPNGDLSAGFAQQGNPDFTAVPGLCAGPFCDFNGIQNTGNWAVDILNVTSATGPASVPEPGTILLGGCGIALAAVMARRKTTLR
jgi:hypothetical protein